MSLPDLVLWMANAVYSTSYVASRLVLDEVPPAMLALIRLAVGAAVLVAVCRDQRRAADHRGAPVGRSCCWRRWSSASGWPVPKPWAPRWP